MKKIIFLFLMILAMLTQGFALSDEAHKYMVRGKAALEDAKSHADFESALKEFQQVILLAPNYAPAYYNMGIIQEGLGLYDDAISNLNMYLKLKPKAKDRQAVEDEITKIEYKKGKGFSAEDLYGTWVGPEGAGTFVIGPVTGGEDGEYRVDGQYRIKGIPKFAFKPEFIPGSILARVGELKFDGRMIDVTVMQFYPEGQARVPATLSTQIFKMLVLNKKIIKAEEKVYKIGRVVQSGNYKTLDFGETNERYFGEWIKQ